MCTQTTAVIERQGSCSLMLTVSFLSILTLSTSLHVSLFSHSLLLTYFYPSSGGAALSPRPPHSFVSILLSFLTCQSGSLPVITPLCWVNYEVCFLSSSLGLPWSICHPLVHFMFDDGSTVSHSYQHTFYTWNNLFTSHASYIFSFLFGELHPSSL